LKQFKNLKVVTVLILTLRNCFEKQSQEFFGTPRASVESNAKHEVIYESVDVFKGFDFRVNSVGSGTRVWLRNES
jgi:hypothetical protein